ncbi:MAG: glycosyltransferase [candidate division SR1 bacterium]|nr:glycosyltransferase [candidate division SR1 bacterium]
MQYIWSHYEEYLNKFSGLKKQIFKFTASYLRKWDLKYTHFDKVICNSQYTQKLAEDIYHIKSSVIYPKIKDEYYFAGISPAPKPYFVCVGRLVNFVRECELIIQTFNALKLPLLMIGDGPDAQYLKSIAEDSIIFTGWLDHGDLIDTVKHSAGLINLTKESFGIGTAESLLMGVPVLGYAEGATAELLDEHSGILLQEKSIPALSEALTSFQSKKRDRKLISESFRSKLANFSKPLDL